LLISGIKVSNLMDCIKISGIKVSNLMDCIKFKVRGDNLPVISKILQSFGDNNINIWFVVQVRNSKNLISVTLCVDTHGIEKSTATIRKICPSADITTIPSVHILSVFPYREDPEIAHLFFKTLEDTPVSILAVSTSLSSISCLVRQEQCSTAEESLKKAFGLTEKR